MGDSTDMTVEFLRARLLSERSVSRAARQRADLLAKRVVELEEQFRIVTIQRKKAESAAAEVLAILETQGISYLSEAIDSSSDGEVPCDDTQKEYESSTASRMERSEVEDGLPGSEPEVSPSQGRSLSWKSHINSPNFHDKQRAKQIRQRQRRRSFMTTLQSSSKHQLGKSCRKIKQKDAGSAADSETEIQKPTLDVQGTGKVAFSNYCEDQSEISRETSMGMKKAVADTSDCLLVDDHNRQTEAHPYDHGSGRDEEMERVLEKQAKFIGQFQAEENAQREWEQKYNEKKIATLADYEPGKCIEHSNQSKEFSEPADRIPDNDEDADYEPGKCIEHSNQSKEFSEPADRIPDNEEDADYETGNCIEHSNQSKKEFSEHAYKIPDNDEEATFRVVHTSSNEEPAVKSHSNSEKNDGSEEASYVHFSNGSLPQVTTADSNGQCSNTVGSDLGVQQCDGMSAKETKTITQEFTASAPQCYDMIRNRKQNEVMQVSNGYASNSRSHPHGNRTFEDTSSQTGFPIDTHGKLPKLGPQQKNQLQLQQQWAQAPSSSLGGVLEALQRAKLSLNQELKKMPSLSQGTLALTAQTNAQTRANSSVDGWDISIGLASLFRLPSDTFPPAHFSGPKYYGSGLSFPANRPDAGFTANSNGYRNPTATSYVEGGSRVVLGREYFDNYFGSSTGVPGSNKYSRASSDLSAERAPFHNEFSNSYSDARNGNYEVPPGDRYGLYGGDQTHFDMRML